MPARRLGKVEQYLWRKGLAATGSRSDGASSPPLDLHITFHAVERFALHHPDASEPEVVEAVEQALEIAPQAALPLIGRNSTRPTNSRYRLAEDRQGLFVLEAVAGRSIVVTYLRFGPWQAQLAERIWPRASAEREEVAHAAPSSRHRDELRLACIGAPVANVVIAPDLKRAFGSSGRARAALVEAQLVRSARDEHVLRAGPHLVRIAYTLNRWHAELASP